MALSVPFRPFKFKLINGIGGAAARLGLKPGIDSERIFAAAIENTGLEDFGVEDFRAGFEVLIDSMDREAGLHTIGRLAAPRSVGSALEKRLKLIDWWKHNPEEAQESIEKPVFIVGPPRTGTTILHLLMSLDPANRAPISWEVGDPLPRPTLKDYDSDPRIDDYNANAEMVYTLAPDFAAIHEIEARASQECLAITLYNGYNVVWPLSYWVPSYIDWYRAADPEPSFHFHKRFLQMLQATHKADWWLFKSPAHLNAISAILAVYPDARFVFTHRSPVDIMGSLCSFTWNLTSMFTDKRLVPKAIGEQQVELWHYLLTESMRQRDALPDQSSRFYDLQFADLVGNPVESVQRIYEHFDIPWPETMAAAIPEFLQQNPQGKHGKHQYALEDYALQRGEISERFSSYIDRFALD